MNILRQWVEFHRNDPEPDNPLAMIAICAGIMSLLWALALILPN
jgi:hypothetical protein